MSNSSGKEEIVEENVVPRFRAAFIHEEDMKMPPFLDKYEIAEVFRAWYAGVADFARGGPTC